ncbi:MAG: ParB/RepB/Spo0J family partition protein [Flavobacteriaceae bacterium]|nr:ParB/RepB/Spo0J family partition protein [Flavobacteriaceae bacterium]
MAKKKNNKIVLGRGLGSLLESSEEKKRKSPKLGKKNISVGNVIELRINQIQTNPFQPRDNFNKNKLKELGISIKKLGIIQPVTVREISSGEYQLISGERRLRASKNVGLKTIPAFIRTSNDSELLEMALVENIQREDLDPIEIALCYKRLIEEINITQEQLSDRIGKKRSTITNYLRLLKLDPIIQTGIRDGFLSMAHGRELVGIENRKHQLDLYEKIISDNLSVRKTEALIRNFKSNKKSSSQLDTKPEFIKDGVEFFKNFLKTNVSVKINKEGKGTLFISFKSQEDFNRIKKKFNNE